MKRSYTAVKAFFLYDPSLQFDMRTNAIGFDALVLWSHGMLNEGNSFCHVTPLILLLFVLVKFHSSLMRSDKSFPFTSNFRWLFVVQYFILRSLLLILFLISNNFISWMKKTVSTYIYMDSTSKDLEGCGYELFKVHYLCTRKIKIHLGQNNT